MKRVFIFDFDGTLCDSRDAFLEILNELSAIYFFRRISRDEAEELRGVDTREVVRRLRILPIVLPWVLRSGRARMARRLPELRPFPKLPPALRELRASGALLGCLTSNSGDLVRAFCDREGLPIDFIVSESSLFGKAKLLLQTMRMHSLDPTRDLIHYVGDETRDVQAAKAAGLRSVAVGWGYNRAETLRSLAPDYLIENPEDLKALSYP